MGYNPPVFMDDKIHIYTVTELTRKIKNMLESAFSSVWVEGEISNFVQHTSGHMYFSLKDADSVLSAVMFRNVNKDIKFDMHDGLKVVCFGRISLYEKRGSHQIYVDRLEPKGIGALQLAFEQLKEKLRKEGLFDEERKKTIPFLPSRIGVVTSPTGAAIQDILNIIQRRFCNVEIILNPVKVQGDGAKEEIAEAIRLFNELANVDVMIVGRGGGSLEDLWAFNEEIVARAIAGSDIPVISAVGHEVDWTIADFVSDLRAPTPSAAAELAVPLKEDLLTSIDDAALRLKNALSNVSVQYEQRLDDILEGLIQGEELFIKGKEDALFSIVGKLEALSPLNVLKRGYSITETEDGKIVKNESQVKTGETIVTRFSRGKVKSRVL